MRAKILRPSGQSAMPPFTRDSGATRVMSCSP
jgi:hypothetical protein